MDSSPDRAANSTVPKNGPLFDLRSLFYLLKPSETFYERKEDVPDITLNVNMCSLWHIRQFITVRLKASNLFFSFVIIEQIIILLKNGRLSGRVNDSVIKWIFFPSFFAVQIECFLKQVTSVSAGLISTLPKWVYKSLMAELVTLNRYIKQLKSFTLIFFKMVSGLKTKCFCPFHLYERPFRMQFFSIHWFRTGLVFFIEWSVFYRDHGSSFTHFN